MDNGCPILEDFLNTKTKDNEIIDEKIFTKFDSSYTPEFENSKSGIVLTNMAEMILSTNCEPPTVINFRLIRNAFFYLKVALNMHEKHHPDELERLYTIMGLYWANQSEYILAEGFFTKAL